MVKKIENKKKIFVAMSGGVDSSVAALLLKKQGYNVVGVFMKFWYEADARENRCCSEAARKDAMRVCAKLNIPFLTWDFQKEFKKKVVDDFIAGYKKGMTPNPCVVCNKEIKLGLFLKKALTSGADFVATGHYARIKNYKLRMMNENKTTNHSPFIIHYSLFAAKDITKDQSYFLWTLTQKELKHCLFPIGDYTKEEVRKLAKKYRLPVALKKESQEVCFVKNANTREFLRTRINTNKGDIIYLKTNQKIGEHAGVQFYTIGQRVPIGGTGPYYVADKNLKKNQLFVAKKDDKEFSRQEIRLKNVNWIAGQPPKSQKILARTRYHQPLTKAKLEIKNSRFKLIFSVPQIFVTPGQSAVFYTKEGALLGGGIIK